MIVDDSELKTISTNLTLLLQMFVTYAGSEINFFLREPTGDKPKNFGRQMDGFGRQNKCLFFWFLACHATPRSRLRR